MTLAAIARFHHDANHEIDAAVFRATGPSRNAHRVDSAMCNGMDHENVNAVDPEIAREAVRVHVNVNVAAIVTPEIAANHRRIVVSIHQNPNEVERVSRRNHLKNESALDVPENQPKKLDQVRTKQHRQESDVPVRIMRKTLNRHSKSL